MSSGAYLLAVPFALIGGLVNAVGTVAGGAARAAGAAGTALGAGLRSTGDSAFDVAGSLSDAYARDRMISRELAERSAHLDAQTQRAHEAVEAVLDEIVRFRETLKNMNFQFHAQTMSFEEREEGVSTQVESSLDLENMMFMDVDVQTRQITYVVLDYSDTISMKNARNSAQFKKLALASDLMKQIMYWGVDNPADQDRLNQLIGVVNDMLDDHSVSYGTFRDFVQTRFRMFQRMQDSLEADPELWKQYCALCAMAGQRPRRLSGEALKEEVKQLMKKNAAEKFVAGARRAFMETIREMGLEIRSGHVLDEVPGSLLVDRDNPGYHLFYSEHDVSFMLEMVETGEAGDDSRQQHKNMCQKRREIEKRMAEKGYRLNVCAANDEDCVALDAVEQKQEHRRNRAEDLRRRRALSGKQAKLKMAGGA